MDSQFAPMGTYTVQFAKDYRAEQIRHAEQSRLAAQFRTPRKGVRRRRAAWVSTVAALRFRQTTSDPGPTARIAQ